MGLKLACRDNCVSDNFRHPITKFDFFRKIRISPMDESEKKLWQQILKRVVDVYENTC